MILLYIFRDILLYIFNNKLLFKNKNISSIDNTIYKQPENIFILNY